MTLYTPVHVTQRDGSPCQFANCWAAVGAWLHSGATGGTASVTPSEFRVMAGGGSGKASKPGCPSGFESDITDGLDALGVRSAILRVGKAEARRLLTTPSRALYGISTDFDRWPDAKDCSTGDFDGNHAVGWIPGLAHPARPVMNPLCHDYQSVSLNTVLESALKFARDHGRGGTIHLVRVRRPKPMGLPADAERIEELVESVAQRDEWIARVRALIVELAVLEAPA